ncbi:serine/threonine protein kinase [Parabacteroides sp. PF5-5]|uniref:serine/threonine-protein kinase n=1 Tax=unclassified Parabacteroides TaxID=2649774 RepID=UPI0024762297|nr:MULTISPECIES: serine/threonine-protein kinase [unclassified Parabacteroides]MDH6306340.1 serine/threonine protein kinase [Parabacteroides sp. PH5-39]MDH6314612.1 serine/threonine protein kinase [Parabacteroides sp. PF5-13]MDH6321051.1 serine/threonine protein kinase [Parabacteroides sp. PH5-13]MDH6324783.1 serine/threonine protein kinase [Parabacteroides sp. PH5-8]MDH6325536.1 serine/threonine protein kinase [Parabacteroides sp. PH5-41]
MNLPIGHYLQNGKYQLLNVVGQGGFGITYKGILFTEVKGPLGKIKTEVPISIKEYFFKDYCYRVSDTYEVDVHSETGKQLFDKFKEKLIKEAKILSDVHYPHIVNVLDVFEENNTAYIAMEYIQGHSLKYILERDGILPEQKVLKYIHQIGKALQFVHEKNILHLDIKPSNILIDKNDNARLIDFGVSKRYDVEDKETSTTMLTLSKGFASIEQYDNEGTQIFSPCPDVYSLGATMYNLLTGKIPTESILRATRPLQNPSELNPAISQKTEEVILKAMQISPSDRFHTIHEMMEALDDPPEEEQTPRHTGFSDAGHQSNSDETTILHNPSLLTGKDDEQTLVNTPAIPKTITKKKSKKTVWFITLICIFALIGSSVVLLMGNNEPVTDKLDLPLADPVDKELSSTQTDADSTILSESTEPRHQILPQPVVHSTENDVPSNEVVDSLMLTEEEIELQYEALRSSGITKMDNGDYFGAREDFNKAIELKPTKDIMRLSISNDEKIEQKAISDRKALYEEKMSFGRFKIVRKISSRRYGAIDDHGNEKIPCKYTNVEVVSDGERAFVREDKLYDIYNTDGVLVRSDVTF